MHISMPIILLSATLAAALPTSDQELEFVPAQPMRPIIHPPPSIVPESLSKRQVVHPPVEMEAQAKRQVVHPPVEMEAQIKHHIFPPPDQKECDLNLWACMKE